MSVIIRDADGKEIKVAGLGGGSPANAVTVPGGAAITMGEGIGAGGYQFKFTPEGDEPDLTASDVGYDNTGSGLAATTVQGAVDEVADKLAIDGVPVGTVISFLGLTAPNGYLVCDGASYSIADYPALSAFIAAQFGSANHFGGDGTATFAVPDMRNLFLRGYHGAAEEQLSGDVGARQEATEVPRMMINTDGTAIRIWVSNPTTTKDIRTKHFDKGMSIAQRSIGFDFDLSYEEETASSGTVRPVNMAILFCIKSV